MVFEGVRIKRILLTGSTSWSAGPCNSDVNPGGSSHLEEIRHLLFQEDCIQVRNILHMSHP